MKILLLTLVFSLSVFANHHEELEGKTFEEKKAHALKKVEEHQTHMTTMKSCISAASDEAALKECRKEAREHRKEMKEEWHKKKDEMKAKMKK